MAEACLARYIGVIWSSKSGAKDRRRVFLLRMRNFGVIRDVTV
jgi:hypothetical protein